MLVDEVLFYFGEQGAEGGGKDIDVRAMLPHRRTMRKIVSGILRSRRTYSQLGRMFCRRLRGCRRVGSSNSERFTRILLRTCGGKSIDTLLLRLYKKDVFSLLQSTCLVPGGFRKGSKRGPILLASMRKGLLRDGGERMATRRCRGFRRACERRRYTPESGLCLTSKCSVIHSCARNVRVRRGGRGGGHNIVTLCTLPSAEGLKLARTRTCTII